MYVAAQSFREDAHFSSTSIPVTMQTVIMILFLKDIPANTRPNELHDYVFSAFTNGGDQASGRVLKAEVMVIRDKQTNGLEHHGLVFVDSRASGMLAIQNLSGKPFSNTCVSIRPYVHRDLNNDRRLLEASAGYQQRGIDRRRGDRIEIHIDLSNVFHYQDDMLPA